MTVIDTTFNVDEVVTGDTRGVIAQGLGWLFDTIQPPGAILSHHGISSPAVGNRWFSFVPSGGIETGFVPVIVVRVAYPRYSNHELVNPLGGEEEMRAWRDVVEGLGYRVSCGWNWNGRGDTGSLALDRLAAGSLIAAVQLYHKGCPSHPDKLVFCKCGWYLNGNEQLVTPSWPEALALGGVVL